MALAVHSNKIRKLFPVIFFPAKARGAVNSQEPILSSGFSVDSPAMSNPPREK